MVLVGLDGALCRVDAVVGRFDELPFAIFLLEEGLDGLGALVVGDVKGRFVSFISQFVEHRFKCFDDGLIFEIADWLCKNVVGVIVVCNKKYCMPSRERTGSAPVWSVYIVPVCLSASAAKQNMLVALFVSFGSLSFLALLIAATSLLRATVF